MSHLIISEQLINNLRLKAKTTQKSCFYHFPTIEHWKFSPAHVSTITISSCGCWEPKNRIFPRVWTFFTSCIILWFRILMGGIARNGSEISHELDPMVTCCRTATWKCLPRPKAGRTRACVWALNKSQRRRASENSKVSTTDRKKRSKKKKNRFSRVLKLSFWKFTGSVV